MATVKDANAILVRIWVFIVGIILSVDKSITIQPGQNLGGVHQKITDNYPREISRSNLLKIVDPQ